MSRPDERDGIADPPPNPLGLTGAGFAHQYGSALRRGERGALEAYAGLFRAGVWPAWALDVMERLGWSVAAMVGPVDRTHSSESGEGTVLKFTQRVAREVGARSRGAVGSVARPVGGGLDEGEAQRPRELARELPVISIASAPSATLETESVLIPMIGKRRIRAYTLCVSSQVGCAMGCTFCQTAQMGLVRSLSAAEIVGQWFAARHLVTRPDPEAEVRNIVFMGMGEPMDNLGAVLEAIEVLTDRRGPSVAMSRVTISTVGRVDGINKLAAHVTNPGWHRLGLAISVNATNDAARSRIMPVNRAMPMARLRGALECYPLYASRHFMLEYVLIPGENDGLQHADELASFVLGASTEADARAVGLPFAALPEREGVPRYAGPRLAACVNVIPYNPRENSPWPAPSEESIDAFCERLSGYGVYVKRRRTKGRDQMAACGQLGNLAYRRPGLRGVLPGASAGASLGVSADAGGRDEGVGNG